jgi:hypothetical protein
MHRRRSFQGIITGCYRGNKGRVTPNRSLHLNRQASGSDCGAFLDRWGGVLVNARNAICALSPLSRPENQVLSLRRQFWRVGVPS